jgi:O-antigen ligase
VNDAPPRRPGGLARLIALLSVCAGSLAVLEVGFPPAARSRLPVLALSLALALLSAWNPARGLVVFSAVFPLAGLGDRLFGGADAIAWPILLFGGFAAGWTFRFLYDFENAPDPTRLDGTLRALSALWVLAALLSALRARTLWALVHGLGLRAVNVEGLLDPEAIRDALLSLAALGCGAAYFFVLRRAGESGRRAALTAATWGVALSAAAALASRVGIGPGEATAFWRATGRSSGASTDPNALGLLCGLAAVVTLACVAAGNAAQKVAGGPGRRALAALIVPVAIGLFLSGSRSGIGLATVGAALLLVLPGIPGRRRAALLAVVLAAVAAAVLIAPRREGNVLERLGRLADPARTVDDRSSSRTVLWDSALRMFRRDPVAGGGLGAFAWELPNLLQESGRTLPMRDNPGNAYLQALAETGILGFVLTLAFCLGLAREGWLAARGAEPLARGAGAASLAFLGALATGSHWFAPDVALYAFLLAAVCARARAAAPSPRAARVRVLLVALYAAAALVALLETRSAEEAFRYRPGLGFHAREVGPGGPFWWTERRFAIRLEPGRSMRLGLAHFTPEGKPVTLTAESGGRRVFERVLAPGEGVRLRLSADAAPRVVRFTLSRAFVPKRLGLSADRRQLGLVAVFPP